MPTQHPRVFPIEHTLDGKEPKALGTLDARGITPAFNFYPGVTMVADQLLEIARQADGMVKAADPDFASRTGRVVAALDVAQMSLEKRREALLRTIGLWRD